MSDKLEFVQALQAQMTILAQVREKLETMHGVYFDRSYGSGGENEITDADVAGINLTAEKVSAAITLAEQEVKLMTNQATTPGDYDKILSDVRADM